MSLASDVDEACDCAMIRGFEILVYTNRYAETLGTVLDYRVHYGASPVRDKHSMDAYIAELMSEGADFTVHPIIL